jgi:hypothetical protein
LNGLKCHILLYAVHKRLKLDLRTHIFTELKGEIASNTLGDFNTLLSTMNGKIQIEDHQGNKGRDQHYSQQILHLQI